jgi:hypothetical protein
VTTTTQFLNSKSLVEFARSTDPSFAQTFYDKLATIQALRDSYFIIASVNVIVRFPANFFLPNHNSYLIQVIAFRMLQFLERHQQLSLLTRTLRASFKASMWFLIVFFVIFIGAFLPPSKHTKHTKIRPHSPTLMILQQHFRSRASFCGGSSRWSCGLAACPYP